MKLPFPTPAPGFGADLCQIPLAAPRQHRLLNPSVSIALRWGPAAEPALH